MLTTIFSPEGRKALIALATSVVGYGVAIGILDPGAAQTAVAVVAAILNVWGVYQTTNAPAS